MNIARLVSKILKNIIYKIFINYKNNVLYIIQYIISIYKYIVIYLPTPKADFIGMQV